MTGDRLPSERKVIALVGVLFLNLILVSSNVILENQKSLLQNVIAVIVSPFKIAFQRTVDYTSHQLRHYVFLKGSFQKYHQLKKKYTRLKYENYLLKQKLIDQDFVKNVKTKAGDFINASTISIDRDFPLTAILIDKGSNHGIEKDMTVLNTRGELVGKIVEPVTLFSARVRLITSSVGGTGAYIENEDPEQLLEGLLTGNNNDTCNFEYLIENKEVNIGDVVITSGTDEVYPPYIPIGKVISVEKEYLTQDIQVKPFFIKYSIKQLIVISNDREKEDSKK
jgi:rod shape-determining protein MreC